MALLFLTALLVAFAVSPILSDDMSEQQTEQLVAAVSVAGDAVAILSSVDDPRMKCLTTSTPVFQPENLFAVFRYHYKGQNGQPGTYVDYCVNFTVTDSFTFGFDDCGDGVISSEIQAYYFNGESCFVGRFPLLDNDYCLLMVGHNFKDSVTDDCVSQFDKNCGKEKYILYDKEQCS